MGRILAVVLAVACVAGPAAAQEGPPPVYSPQHFAPWPNLATGQSRPEIEASLNLGPELERAQSPREMLADRRKLDAALAALQPQRKGVVDAYVVSIALDSDAVFAREAREAGRVLTRRYNATGRSITLAGPDGHSADLPKGSLTALTLVLARVAELMDLNEDVLVLYTTSHGAPEGIAYHDGDTGYGLLSPSRLGVVLGELGIKRRILLLSACYSGAFVPFLDSPDTAMMTAAAADRTSFGCQADSDWTFFGDALVNNALRKPESLSAATAEARTMISGWEASRGFEPSLPQIDFGSGTSAWLGRLEARIPQATTAHVGVPAIDSVPVVAGR